LVQQDKVELDKPVTEYLPEFSMQDERYKDITVRMLLNHTSGLPGTNFKNGFAAEKHRDYVRETLELLQGTYLVNDPGRISVYCNDGFTVAEAVIERVSGLSFAEFLEQEIFTKLGLTNTSAYFKEGNENIARVYEGDSTFPLPLEYVNILGSGGLASTAVDLCKFGEILQPGSILSPSMLEEYTRAQYGPETVPVGSPLFCPGLGWDFVSVPMLRRLGVNVIAKDGGTMQYFSQLCVLPKERINVAVIFAGAADPAAVADTVLEATLRELGLMEEAAAQPAPPADAPIPGELQRFAGFYNSTNGLVQVALSEDKSSIILSTFDGSGFVPSIVAAYKEDGKFHESNGLSFSFAEHRNGTLLLMHFSESPDVGHAGFEKLRPAESIDPGAFLGKAWVPVNLGRNDLYLRMFKTLAIPELPGYIIVADGQVFTPLALSSPTSTKMSFHYVRDQFEVSLQEMHGETVLHTSGEYFIDAAMLPVIKNGDDLQIERAGHNKSRVFGFSGQASFDFPENGRVVVFSQGCEAVYDSLKTPMREAEVEEGMYLVFIGEPGDTLRVHDR
jgi:CubicO group peptidase (beta-lactamase class C family)